MPGENIDKDESMSSDAREVTWVVIATKLHLALTPFDSPRYQSSENIYADDRIYLLYKNKLNLKGTQNNHVNDTVKKL